MFPTENWRPGQALHPLFPLVFFSCLNIEPDELHIVHLGVSPCMLASVLWILVYKILPGTPKANMYVIWTRLCERYKDICPECQYGNLNINSFIDPEKWDKVFPKLKGRGAEAKDLVLPLLQVWSMFMDGDDNEHILIQEMLTHQVDVQGILSNHADQPLLPRGAANDLQLLIDLILKKYVILSQAADDRKELLWPCTPKLHWYWHLGQRAQHLNPRRANCMLDEDFVGHIKTVVAGCVHGTRPHVVPQKMGERMRWAMHVVNRYGA